MRQEDSARFREAVERLSGRQADAQFGIAVSGGPDSMALLWLALNAFPGRVMAATVDHGLRPEAADEAAMVAAFCARHGVPHATLRPARPITGNIQSQARTARYALLDQWRMDNGVGWLMTAHHAGDQIETMLMRLNRGAGVGGLAGVRARNGQVIRPLLHWTKAELVALLEDAGIGYASDPSNQNAQFDRVAMRQALARAEWLDAAAAARSADALADAEAALLWMTGQLAAARISDDADGWRLDARDVPAELRRRLLLRMLRMADPAMAEPRGGAVDIVIARLDAGEKASLGDWVLSGGEAWVLRPAPPRRKL